MIRKPPTNKYYLKYKKAGLCRRCGSIPLSDKTRCAKCHEAHLGYQRIAKEKAKQLGKCRTCLHEEASPNKSQCDKCLEKLRLREQKRQARCRKQCIEAYGGVCKCCGISVEKYFQLDHINNDRAKHKKLLTGNPRQGNMYRWAVKNGFPKILQILCCNCHQAKSYFGGCTKEDHKRMKMS